MFEIESQVRSYCRQFPAVFDRANGSKIILEDGTEYLDFLSGCGTLNYGHNNISLRDSLLSYINIGGIAHGLDLETTAKSRFLELFKNNILYPRNLDFKVQFPGPTGTNAVEAAIKLARKCTNRSNVVAFTNAFHGCTLGSLSLTGSAHHRGASGPLLQNVTRWPYDGYFGPEIDTAAMLDQVLSDPSGGIDPPAAIIVENVQGEGGLSCTSSNWMRKIRQLADKHQSILIVDDIQAGCGRTGKFFSFEHHGVLPDMVVLAKAISGFGLPMSLLLIRPDLDTWCPGEHNGTFRGNNHAFVTASAALETFWQNDDFEAEISEKSSFLREALAVCRI
jgi:diaminobutyrate-2-oxoglutarate transaminase